MRFVLYLSDYMIPLVVFYIICHGLFNKTKVFDVFVKGAWDGIKMVAGIMPTLIGLMVAVGLVRACGFLDWLSDVLAPVAGLIHFPAKLIPLWIIKMFSSSAATGLLLDIYKECGTDSVVGKIASIMMSCTETIFYTMSVYFMAAKVSKTRWTLFGALICTLAGTVAAVLFGMWM